MSFVPNTEKEQQEMLNFIGVSNFEELLQAIPKEIRLKEKLSLPEKLSELEVTNLINELSEKNKTSQHYINFLGGGAYDHFIPAIVKFVINRTEFKTAYTPYQAEVSQGTLQTMYEFQSMICALTGMDVSNASMYDGASALAEACLMAINHNKKTKFIVAGSLNPNYIKVVKTICFGKNIELEFATVEDGTCDFEKLQALMDDTISGVIVQQPNVYGNIEDVFEIEKITHSKKAMFIVVVDMLSLGLLEAPGNYNADIVVAEGQPLGIPLSYGGPYLGIFATKNEFVRKIPGRIAGITVDAENKRGFVLTLQTREQQIKRDKATSNICTNQGLMMLAATVYMATMGKQGIKEVAELCFQKAHYLASKISSELKNYKMLSSKPFFKEFLLITPVEPSTILDYAESQGVLAGIDTSRYPECKKGLLIAVTEKRTKNEIDKLVEILKKFD